MKLSERLRMNVSLVPKGCRLADIGCDHAYASIWLAEKEIAVKVIATDVNRGPIERAREHVKRAHLETLVDCRQGNGTEKIAPGEVDTFMIAGMGGPLMVRILTEGKEVLDQVNTLILQPQSEMGTVRHFLLENGFSIEKEKICLDEGKYYFAILAVRSKEKTNVEAYTGEWQYRYGTYLAKQGNSLFESFLKKEKRVLEGILQQPGFSGADARVQEEHRRRIREVDMCLARVKEAGNE